MLENDANKLNLSRALDVLGATLWLKGDEKASFSRYQQALSLREAIGNNIFISESLFNLVVICIETDHKKKASFYLQKLKNLFESTTNNLIAQRYRLAKAYKLKMSKRILPRARSFKIFQDISKEPLINSELTIFAMLNMCERLLDELQATNNTEIIAKIISDINTHVNDLSRIIESQKSYTLQVEIYIFQSKLALLGPKGNIELSEDLLTKAENIDNTYNLKKLLKKVTSEKEKFSEQKDEIRELIRSEIPPPKIKRYLGIKNEIENLARGGF